MTCILLLLDNRFDLTKLKEKDPVVMDSDWKWNCLAVSHSSDTVVIHLIPRSLVTMNFRLPTWGWCIRLLAPDMSGWYVSLNWIWGHVIFDNGHHVYYTTLEEVDRRTVALNYVGCTLDVSRGEAFDISTYQLITSMPLFLVQTHALCTVMSSSFAHTGGQDSFAGTISRGPTQREECAG